MFVEVALNRPLNKNFTYHVPEALTDHIQIGKRVKIQFGRAETVGYVIQIHENKPEFETKPILKIVDEEIVFDHHQIELAEWISHYYYCSFGEALAIQIPKEAKSREWEPLRDHATMDLLQLNDEQQIVVNNVLEKIKQNEHHTFLVHGVTGSGKTEVYRHLAVACADLGKQSLVLVPEISLTPQTTERFKEIFGHEIAILHSKLSAKDRMTHYLAIRSGKVSLVLGARSAIFAPFQNLGVIIIDEEHENTYKSADTPRYSARQIAFYLGKKMNIPVVLGSATPSVESYYFAKKNIFSLFEMNKRHGLYQNSVSKILDLRKHKLAGLISDKLQKAIKERIEKKEQVLLFLNRRGFSPSVLCPTCGNTFICSECSVAMTYHQSIDKLICHYCGIQRKVPERCDVCGDTALDKTGFGTERIEDTLAMLFPDAKIARMDSDTTRKKGAHQKLIEQMASGEIDILVGTQMIAKGLHFPNVTLVGVLLADNSLNIPDFRASERTFSLITQVSGRAGRGDIQGEIFIQTFNPEHHSIQTALNHDYISFWKREINLRQRTKNPPFYRIIRLLVRGTNEEKVQTNCMAIAEELRKVQNKESEIIILGPAPCTITKIKRNYRWNILLKAINISSLRPYVKIAKNLSLSWRNTLYLEIDVDPQSFL